jgi:hypothetical protein
MAICLFFSKKGKVDLYEIVNHAVIIFSFLLIPQIILHIKYLLDNSKYSYVLIEDGLSIYKIGPNGKKNHVIDLTNKNISSVALYGTPSVIQNRIHWLPWEGYYYWVIAGPNGNKFIINSLSVDDISTILPTGASINSRHIKLYCWPPSPRSGGH